MRGLALPLTIALAVSPASAMEQADSLAVRVAIEQQMTALQRDDAQAAFAAAAPQLRQQFADSESFMRMIHEQFPVIARPQIVSFGDLRHTSYGLAQLLNLVDERGEPWIALFLMDRGEDGVWRVANVVTVRLPSLPA
ncbi:DUF4864 domain-containing protein [Chelatococcus sp. SYSU_G07232]|uniref:DUF4864 domain-containing protein n=1 Tax=Chelatococcus albus TaxID=3047466 RepID=A0ABT7ACL0_9HYPH|nr:DUF4864 domain-containing protein [Chelatococcus sp. SYSU_G07232]MDJ1157107.1 DUF4864 domain-containing protein [Chelatococcus sp. SYSU_G07232]